VGFNQKKQMNSLIKSHNLATAKAAGRAAKAPQKGPNKLFAESANQITRNIIRIVNMQPGCVAYRINNVGVWDAAKGIHRGGNTEKGLPDIWMCVHGFFVTIEVKAGSDKMSDDQLRRQDEISRAGGLMVVCGSTDSFQEWFTPMLAWSKANRPDYKTRK
jgi:VRR-NUC domain